MVKIKGVNPRVSGVKKPKCPVHDEEMKYEPVLGRWKCTVAECKFTAKRKQQDDDDEVAHHDLPEVKQMMPRKPKPVVGPKKDGITLHLAKDQDGKDRYYLSFKFYDPPLDRNFDVALDVTDHVDTMIDDQTNSVTLCLLFNDIIRG